MTECALKSKRPLTNQTGMAVVVGLLVLALLSLLGITLMGLSVTESQIGSNEADLKRLCSRLRPAFRRRCTGCVWILPP